MTVKEAMNIILTELSLQNKKSIGQGGDKTVYSFINKKDYVIKRFNNIERIKNELEFQEKFPNLFARIIKVDFEKRFCIQERLDTINFKNYLKEIVGYIAKKLPKFNLQIGKNEFYNLGVLEEMYKTLSVEEVNKLKIFLSKEMPFCIKLFNFFKELYYDVEADFDIDLHAGNIGIDKQGNIKLLDI